MSSGQKIGDDSWQIGSVTVGSRAVLAPLSGVTDAVFRRIAKRLGAGLVISEMIASNELVQGSPDARLRAEGSGIDPHVVQLAGRDPRWMSEAVRVAESSGARIVDINMGCPAKRVVGGYAGSALMRDLDLASRLIEAAVSAASVPVTVKMRLGWDHESVNAPELARRAQALGAQAVTIHGRTRQQFYKGAADWTAIAPVAKAVTIPVIANGDVGDGEGARRCIGLSGASAVMVGRAAIGQPWLPGVIGASLQGVAMAAPEAHIRGDIAVEHYEGLLSLYGLDTGLRHARKHLAAYADVAIADGFDVAPQTRTGLVTSEDPKTVLRLLRALYLDRVRKAA